MHDLNELELASVVGGLNIIAVSTADNSSNTDHSYIDNSALSSGNYTAANASYTYTNNSSQYRYTHKNY